MFFSNATRDLCVLLLGCAVFSFEAYSVDVDTAKFVSGKARNLAMAGNYKDAFSEISWILKDESNESRQAAREVLRSFPGVAELGIDSIFSDGKLGCSDAEDPKGKIEVQRLVSELGAFVESVKLNAAQARVDDAFEPSRLHARRLECAGQSQAEWEAVQASRRLEKEQANLALVKELRGSPKVFEVRGYKLGEDYVSDLIKSGVARGAPDPMENFPDTTVGSASDGASLYFHRGTLFMVVFSDVQQTADLIAVKKQLEKKFKGKFVLQPEKSREQGRLTVTSQKFFMKIGNYGFAEIELSASRPTSRQECIDGIAKELRQRIQSGLPLRESLTDRVEEECVESRLPTTITIGHKAINDLADSKGRVYMQKKVGEAVDEVQRRAKEKAEKF